MNSDDSQFNYNYYNYTDNVVGGAYINFSNFVKSDKTDSEPLQKRPKRLSLKLPCNKKVLSENVVERFANPVDDATLGN